MHAETPDKKPIPGNDLSTPLHDEQLPPEASEENKEQDIDDLVHNTVSEHTSEEEEFDEDDAVHDIARHPSGTDDSEKDPDDLVHGN